VFASGAKKENAFVSALSRAQSMRRIRLWSGLVIANVGMGAAVVVLFNSNVTGSLEINVAVVGTAVIGTSLHANVNVLPGNALFRSTSASVAKSSGLNVVENPPAAAHVAKVRLELEKLVVKEELDLRLVVAAKFFGVSTCIFSNLKQL